MTAAPIPNHSLSFLIGDPDPMFRRRLSMILDRTAHRYDAADTLEEALRQYEALNHDVVILDIRLAKKDGLRSLGSVRRMAEYASVILTGTAREELLVAEALSTGALTHLIKPVDRKDLRTLVKKLEQRTRIARL